MALPSDSGTSNPYGYNPNPSDIGYTPPAYAPPPTPSFPAQPSPDTRYSTGAPAPAAPVATNTQNFPNGVPDGSRPAAAAAPAVPAAVLPTAPAAPTMDWASIFNPPWQGQQSQQWLDFMMGPQGVQFQNQLAQQQEDLQKQIQTAAYTADWNGVQTLQSKLQDVQVQLAKNQADMNNAIGLGNLTGQYNGHATLQAQDIMNNLALQARGQDVSMAGIQAQLAQSPLVAWYTARGLPPPTSAIMTGPAAWDPTWDWTNQQGPDPLLGGANSPPTPRT